MESPKFKVGDCLYDFFFNKCEVVEVSSTQYRLKDNSWEYYRPHSFVHQLYMLDKFSKKKKEFDQEVKIILGSD